MPLLGAQRGASDPVEEPGALETGRWERTGAGWTVEFRGGSASLPSVKGMADLARLLARPGAEVHVLDLVDPTAGAPRQGDLGEVLDDRARAAYKRRLEDLEERIADAEADGDMDAVERPRPRSASCWSPS